MQPFDEKIPEEGQPENEQLIAFLRHAYQRPVDAVQEEREQALAHVRERLQQYEETQTIQQASRRQGSPLHLVAGQIDNTVPNATRSRFTPKRDGEISFWDARVRLILAVAAVILLIGSTAVFLQVVHQSTDGLVRNNSSVLAEFKGTGNQTLTLDQVAPKGQGIGIDLSCDGPGSVSVTLTNAFPLINDSGIDDWHHPTILEGGFGSCPVSKDPKGYEVGAGGPAYALTYTLYQVQVKADGSTSWDVKIVSFPVASAPDLHLPTISLPESQVSIGEFAGTGKQVLVPSDYADPIEFHPVQPWQFYLVCRGPGKVEVDLNMSAYQSSAKYKGSIPAQVTYDVACGTNSPVNISQLYPAMDGQTAVVEVDVIKDDNVNWHWVVGMCTDSNTPVCTSPFDK